MKAVEIPAKFGKRVFNDKVMKERLPEKEYSPIVFFNRAQRYEYLISLNAPEIVVNEEARCLAEEMILYFFVNKI